MAAFIIDIFNINQESMENMETDDKNEKVYVKSKCTNKLTKSQLYVTVFNV